MLRMAQSGIVARQARFSPAAPALPIVGCPAEHGKGAQGPLLEGMALGRCGGCRAGGEDRQRSRTASRGSAAPASACHASKACSSLLPTLPLPQVEAGGFPNLPAERLARYIPSAAGFGRYSRTVAFKVCVKGSYQGCAQHLDTVWCLVFLYWRLTSAVLRAQSSRS
jgi:hypothetical protein